MFAVGVTHPSLFFEVLDYLPRLPTKIKWPRGSASVNNNDGMELTVEQDDFASWVQRLSDPVRAKRAYWHLVLSGESALPAIRKGLTAPNADTRMYCARALDHLVDEQSFPELISMLDDLDPRVRWDTLHALACDRCKGTTCRPDKSDVLPRAIAILHQDPSEKVRAIACEVVAGWAHTDEEAELALVTARDNDRSRSVRKKAGWYAPGGTIYKKTQSK